MTDNSLGDAVLLLLEYFRRSRSEEERKVLGMAASAAAFLSFSGQLYRFEDFRASARSGQVLSLPLAHVARALERLRAQAPSVEEKETLLAAREALDFIAFSGQHAGLEDYLDYKRQRTLPPVQASFKTHEEAQAWLEAQADPPHMARVLIGGEYHSVLATRKNRDWSFGFLPLVAEFIERRLRDGLPPVEAAFDTREEAEAWLAGLDNPPRHAFVSIGGEHYLAACWENVKHRALYPFTLAKELEKERQARERRLAGLETDGETEPT